ncbi:hypothetical protein [Halodesulfovibrio sp.]|jgi:uncharacterized membrane protein|uniref:hypothetical protein n=1 Tax=Halodesulfovibrio sp. TaxID=1912772 RepID=UPI0025CEA83A|nr:hypothetical protein [Halodesulfovibrio sp.]MCT4627951.1 hypothetical protein [Halodesulfovibrio sp.]
MPGVREAFEKALKDKFTKFFLFIVKTLLILLTIRIVSANIQPDMAQLAWFGIVLKLMLCGVAVIGLKAVNVLFHAIRGRNRKALIDTIQENPIATSIYVSGNSLAAALVFGLILSS